MAFDASAKIIYEIKCPVCEDTFTVDEDPTDGEIECGSCGSDLYVAEVEQEDND